MIIEVFVVLGVLSLILICLGYFGSIPFLGMIGFISMFLLSFVLINEDLQYRVGASVDNSNPLLTNISYTLVSYTGSHQIGIYLAIVFAFLFILSIIKETGVYDNWRENYEENNY